MNAKLTSNSTVATVGIGGIGGIHEIDGTGFFCVERSKINQNNSGLAAEKLAATLDQDHNKPLHDFLSDREFNVLKMLAAGRSVSEIAESLSLSVTTVSTYRARIMIKMNMKTNANLTLYAIENNLL